MTTQEPIVIRSHFFGPLCSSGMRAQVGDMPFLGFEGYEIATEPSGVIVGCSNVVSSLRQYDLIVGDPIAVVVADAGRPSVFPGQAGGGRGARHWGSVASPEHGVSNARAS